MTCETIELLAYFQLITNSLTHSVVALLSIENGVYCKALGRRTGRRPSPMEQTPPAQPGTRGRGGKKLGPGKYPEWQNPHFLGLPIYQAYKKFTTQLEFVLRCRWKTSPDFKK